MRASPKPSDEKPADKLQTPPNEPTQPKNAFVSPPEASQQALSPQAVSDGSETGKPRKRLFWLKLAIPVVILAALAVVGGKIYYHHWYQDNLRPLSSVQQRIVVKIQPGMTAKGIGQLLEKSKVIRSGNAFYIYTKNSGKRGDLQAGTYMFSPNQSVEQIVEMLASGQTNIFNVTILPGQTLDQIKDQLVKDGYQTSEIDKALGGKYNSPIFQGKPAGASLEGYIFPDTYQIDADTTVRQLLQKTFDNFAAKITQSGLTPALKAHNLNLHQAIILASIIQKEDSDASVQPQIAQVFLLRLKKGMVLGSDVTAIYGTQRAGQNLSVAEAVGYDSPYNTRLHPGLPPGPIANFNLSSLTAVAHPASGDYLYFVAGDDGAVHFARTEAEHQQNVDKYCQKLCQ